MPLLRRPPGGLRLPTRAGRRLAWTGSCFWLDACLQLGFFTKRVPGGWAPCAADDPESVPDVGRLLRQCVWNRAEKRFERRRATTPGSAQ